MDERVTGIQRLAAGAIGCAVATGYGAAPVDRSATPLVQVAAHLRLGDTVGDVLRHPAFARVGRRLLPWDTRPVDARLPLRELGTLLPYHTHVDPATVVSALNRMVDDAGAGRTIFYEFHSAAEQEAEPSLRSTGLFYFRGKTGAPFALIAPGGGFAYVASVHEGFPYAAAISRLGCNAFVLKYRAGVGGSAATEDLAAALTYIVRHAGELGVTPTGYSLWGSSAGARMAASVGTHGAERFGGAKLTRPAAAVLLYTGHADVGPSEPPTFVAVGEDDGIAPPEMMARRVSALRRGGTVVEFHRYPGVGHGFGPGVGTSAEGWLEDAVRFWSTQIDARIGARAASDCSL